MHFISNITVSENVVIEIISLCFISRYGLSIPPPPHPIPNIHFINLINCEMYFMKLNIKSHAILPGMLFCFEYKTLCLDDNVAVIGFGAETKFLHYYSNRYSSIEKCLGE